jgi:hypothetical protein
VLNALTVFLSLFVLQSQIKKGFFGALRIRKQEEAADLSLTSKQPATTITVYNVVKTCMKEALQIARQQVLILSYHYCQVKK